MRPRLIVFLVLTGSYFAFFLVFPLFPTIFLNEGYHFLPAGTSSAMGNILLGLCYASYSLGNFIGTPFMGKLSDRNGRKQVLSCSLLLSAVMCLLSLVAIQSSSLYFLLIARFFTGFFDTSFALSYNILVDMDKDSDAQLKNIEFWTSTATNGGWILGSLIGWQLIDQPVLSFQVLSLPQWGAFFILLLLWALVVFALQFPDEVRRKQQPIENPFVTVINSFRPSPVRPILIANIILYSATFIFSTYLPIFLMRKFSFAPSSIGTIDTYLSVSTCFAPFTYWIFNRFCSRKETVCISTLGIGLSLLFLVVVPFKELLWLCLFFNAYFSTVAYSFSTFLVIEYSPFDQRGEALGINQALYVLVEGIVSFLSGLCAALWFYLPFIIATLCAFVAALLFFCLVVLAPKKIAEIAGSPTAS